MAHKDRRWVGSPFKTAFQYSLAEDGEIRERIYRFSDFYREIYGPRNDSAAS